MALKERVRLRWRFVLWLMLVVGVVASALSIWKAANNAWDSARQEAWLQHRFMRVRSTTYWFFRQISLPPAIVKDKAGSALYSWRFRSVWGLDEYIPKGDWSKPWNDPANEDAVACGNTFFCFPYLFDRESPASQRCHGNMAVVTGCGTPFEEGKTYRHRELPPNLILVVEVADTGAHWADPGDLNIDELPLPLTKGPDGDGFLVGFVDFQVWFLRNDVPLDVLRKFLTIHEAEKANREELLGPYGREVKAPREQRRGGTP